MAALITLTDEQYVVYVARFAIRIMAADDHEYAFSVVGLPSPVPPGGTNLWLRFHQLPISLPALMQGLRMHITGDQIGHHISLLPPGLLRFTAIYTLTGIIGRIVTAAGYFTPRDAIRTMIRFASTYSKLAGDRIQRFMMVALVLQNVDRVRVAAAPTDRIGTQPLLPPLPTIADTPPTARPTQPRRWARR